MTSFTDPQVWLAILGAGGVGWLVGFPQADLLRANDRPEIVGAARRRCEVCEDAWAVPTADPYDDLDLCASCRKGLDDAAGRSSR